MGKKSSFLENPPPPFPEPLSYLWDWFKEIRPGVQGNGYSYPVITWTEFDCWANRMKQDPEPREARAIIILGTMHANILSEKVGNSGA
jgi:hypothetical protein